MSDIAIKVENLSKLYRIGNRESYKALRDVLSDAISAPFRWFRNSQSANNYFWALKDISFEVKKGEVIGIIGRNGAGKSTLLKILCRITEPTEGYAKIYGRVGSLLEVGTGFHPELTGRENIYLNGAILGMSKAEINRKFDEIVAFAEVEKFIDTPVKHYSSGMYTRLAFAVAAHMETEILLVDEVLAVGDITFQKKCLGKMEDVAKKGRTVLFVSHNMAAVKKLCARGILLEYGSIVKKGSIEDVVNSYLDNNIPVQEFKPIKIDTIGLEIQKITLNEDAEGVVIPFKPLSITLDIFAENDVTGIGLQIMITKDAIDGIIFYSNTKQTKGIDVCLRKGMNKITCLISNFNLCSGKYMLGFGIDHPNVCWDYYNKHVLSFHVKEIVHGGLLTLPIYSHFYLDHCWISELPASKQAVRQFNIDGW